MTETEVDLCFNWFVELSRVKFKDTPLHVIVSSSKETQTYFVTNLLQKKWKKMDIDDQELLEFIEKFNREHNGEVIGTNPGTTEDSGIIPAQVDSDQAAQVCET